MGLPRLLAAASVAAALLAVPAVSSAATPTTWLCKPGMSKNPCTSPLTATVIPASGERSVERTPLARRPKVDCFYVYPTVSGQDRVNATLKVDPEQRAIAQYQASRYSQVCRVFAPMYRQLTLRAINQPRQGDGDPQRIAFRDVRDAWREYLRKHNKGRGVLLVGHSQGSFMLRELITREIDRRASVRRQIVAAHLLGGNVTVRKGSDRGGDFRNVRACRSDRQVGCVVAYSMYDATPPRDSRFGRVRGADADELEVLCTNPGALAGGPAALDAYNRTTAFPGLLGVAVAAATELPRADTPWVKYPGRSTGQCRKADGAVWLDVAPRGGSADARPLFKPVPDAGWGLHLGDINIAWGQLTALARRQTARWLARQG
jgi:hypothetical protein